MHLKQLKLAGFKSFVEPTVIPFADQLIAIVGPNGCGKSNIIDAVRWVMGESLAKNLRGEAISDVIFKGSSERKPVGQASVELIFDNSLGRLTGSFAPYQEISIKRVVTLEGDSQFYLNGTRCRKRDITDIFLGTGAGARGYSIIGQGTISRLIEADPEDLRAYFEEAADISKYKERRRETLTRIKHTQENLTRIADIREELAQQLARLEHQAQAAQHYITLKQQERLCRSEILALKWRAAQQELRQHNLIKAQVTQDYTVQQARYSELEQALAHAREEEQTCHMQAQQLQEKIYQVATEIARLDAAISQRQREDERLAAERQQLNTDLQTEIEQLHQEEYHLQICTQTVKHLEHQLKKLHFEYDRLQANVTQYQSQEHDWLKAWQKLERELQQNQKERQVNALRLEHLEEQKQRFHIHMEKLHQEQENLALDEQVATILHQQRNHDELKQSYEMKVEAEQHVVQHGVNLRTQMNTIEQQLFSQQSHFQTLSVEYAALTAAQKTALQYEQVEQVCLNELSNSSDSNRVSSPRGLTVESRDLNTNLASTAGEATKEKVVTEFKDKPRVAEILNVPEVWIPVCERIFREFLSAVIEPNFDLSNLSAWQGQELSMVTVKPVISEAQPYPRLIDFFGQVVPAWPMDWQHVFTAPNLQEALTGLPHLQEHQSMITPEGYWLGHGWVRMLTLGKADEAGILARKLRLEQIQRVLAELESSIASMTEVRSKLQCQITAQQEEQNVKMQETAVSLDTWRQSAMQLQQDQKIYEQSLSRQQQLQQDMTSAQLENEQCVHRHYETNLCYQQLEQESLLLAKQQKQLLHEKSSWHDALLQAKNELEKTQAAKHQSELAYQREEAKLQQLSYQIQRQKQHIELLQSRAQKLLEQAQQRQHASEDPLILAQKKQQHTELEKTMLVIKEKLQGAQQHAQTLDVEMKKSSKLLKNFEEKLQTLSLHTQTLQVRLENFQEANQDLTLDSSLFEIQDITLVQRERDLAQLESEIQSLGAINLLAIEEYQVAEQRKQHLDQQHQDLSEAIATLHGAIAKMDCETQQRLQETFDQVNAAFQKLFPKLFGGGHAKLVLTCDNLLEAGIVVMAQPPGKRNSTIHMLSGGEKALTAVALVFAIFQLNPSPFCMLDEVDAPLDDTNIRRFCELVKEMSSIVQFLLITHNKITMEIANHLIGVTMQEPGVSRIVTVDVKNMVSV